MRYVLLLGLLLCLPRPDLAQPRAVKSAQIGERYQQRLATRAAFDRLARIYYQGRFYALPHLMFVIDRANQNTVYFVNSKRYSFHSEFVNANYLTLERGREFFRHNYLEATRRFVLGTIAYQTRLDKYTFEFWEGDLATHEIVRETQRALNASFFAPLYFKPNSARQEEAAAKLPDLPQLLPSETNPPQDYLPLNQAQNAGVLRILDQIGRAHV